MQCNSNQIKSELPSIVEYQECVTQKLMPFVLPFLQNIDIHTFGYRKFLLDGRSFGFCTNEKWNLFYKNNLLQLNIQSYEKEVELASQKEAASAIQASSKAGASQNIDEQIKAVENKLSDIQSDIKMTLAESGSGSEQGKDISEIDSIIKQTKSPEDVLSQLDKILGPSSK